MLRRSVPTYMFFRNAILVSICWVITTAVGLRAENFEAISSRASPDYIRPRRSDGAPAVETYAFGDGGYYSGPVADKTIAGMDFLKIAHVMAVPLAEQHYVPAKDPNTANLLIMVYWGTTYAPEHASESQAYQNVSQIQSTLAHVDSLIKYAHEVGLISLRNSLNESLTTAVSATQAENRMRDNANAVNAELLGYESWWNATFNAAPTSPLAVEKQDMLTELEEDRYFVVLMAYDFKLLLKQKKHKLLWETRFSIREHSNQFDRQLPAMALQASRYFGRDSNGLTHDPIPEGKVDIGSIEDLGSPAVK